MVNKISIVISKNNNGYSVNFPELEPIDYQDSSLDGVINRVKDTLQTYLISSEVSQETTGESILNMVNKYDLTEEQLDNLPIDGAEEHDHYLYGSPKKSQ
jgi:predicted RNase H-like HicB family nuclease